LVGTKVRGRGKIDKICSNLFNALPDEEIAYWEQQCTAEHSSGMRDLGVPMPPIGYSDRELGAFSYENTIMLQYIFV